MDSPPIFSNLLLVSLLWLCFMLHGLWPATRAAMRPTPPTPTSPPRKRPKAPQPFAGLLHQPLGTACAQATASRPKTPGAPPPLLPYPRGRQRTVDTQEQCWPAPAGASAGWTGRGNSRAHGPPGGTPWRPLPGVACPGDLQETDGTILQGTHVAPALLVWAGGALAEGVGIRAVARVFEVDPNTGRPWLVAGADQFQACSPYCLRTVRGTQVQVDALFALLSAGKAGEGSEAEALTRLTRSPHWVWVAIAPVSQLLLTIDSGDRTLALAQRVVHPVVEGLAPGCVPFFLTDGCQEYPTAWLAPCGSWLPPARRQATGPNPKPRGLPLPPLRYAQVGKTGRRQRLVDGQPRVVCGTWAAGEQVLAP